MFEIEPTRLGPGRKPLILNQLKKTVEVESVKLDRAGKPLFLDKAGKAIPNPLPVIRPELKQAKALMVQKFTIEGRPISATIPTFDKSNPNQWVPNGQKTTKLALVGMHVVGSTKGHPEMIWASFEHFGNSPKADYTYNATSGPNPKTVSQSTSGTWLFAATGSLRFRPWGKDSGNSSASSNTEVISINNSVRGQLPAADMRNNYFMLGSTWTIGGAAPTSGNQVGTNKLANSTLETYAQGTGPRRRCSFSEAASRARGRRGAARRYDSAP